MADDVVEALDGFQAYSEPRDGLGSSPFRLVCTFEGPASETEIASAWPDDRLPEELAQIWATSRQSRLFEDVDYGQWGLILFSPDRAAWRTMQERMRRPDSYHDGDVVIGEFLGDQELIVVAQSGAEEWQVLVALPLDDRRDWYVAASSLAEFLERYLAALGDKYWERARE